MPALRDQGIRTQILQMAIQTACTNAAAEIHTNVDEIDEDTRRFHERHGFSNIETSKDYRMLSYVQAHGGARVGVSGGDLGVAQVYAGVEHGGDERVAKHVRVHARDLHAGGGLQVSEPAGGGVAVHAGAAAVLQDRPAGTVADGALDRARDGRWHRHEHDLVAFADDPQHPVAVFFAEVGDVQAGGFGDPQPE